MRPGPREFRTEKRCEKCIEYWTACGSIKTTIASENAKMLSSFIISTNQASRMVKIGPSPSLSFQSVAPIPITVDRKKSSVFEKKHLLSIVFKILKNRVFRIIILT